MKNLTILTSAVIIMLFFAQCQSSIINGLVSEMNKQFPVSSNGILIEKAEAIDGNTIKLHCTLEGDLFTQMDAETWQQFSPVMKQNLVISLQNQPDICQTLTKIKAIVLYEFKNASGQVVLEIRITPEDLLQKENPVMLSGDEMTDMTVIRQNMIDAIKPNLPIMVSEADDMMLVDVYAAGNFEYVYVYEIPRKNLVSEDPVELKAVLLKTFKETPAFVSKVKQGLEAVYVYRDKATKNEIVRVKITKDDL